MIPLGGYVQMLESKNQDGQPNEIDENDQKYCFDKKMFTRFAVVAAGPIFNLILAVIFFAMTLCMASVVLNQKYLLKIMFMKYYL